MCEVSMILMDVQGVMSRLGSAVLIQYRQRGGVRDMINRMGGVVRSTGRGNGAMLKPELIGEQGWTGGEEDRGRGTSCLG